MAIHLHQPYLPEQIDEARKQSRHLAKPLGITPAVNGFWRLFDDPLRAHEAQEHLQVSLGTQAKETPAYNLLDALSFFCEGNPAPLQALTSASADLPKAA